MQTEINKELILTRYLTDMLLYGKTTGVTLDEYNKMLNIIIKTLNLSSFKILKKQKVDATEFSNIIKSANELNGKKENGIEIKYINQQYLACATYHLEKNNEIGYMIDPIINVLIRDQVTKGIDNIRYSAYNMTEVTEKVLGVAARVSAYYVNELIEKYINNQVQSYRWPIQCKDIDEYIFKKDIAKNINEPGTSKVFKHLYLHAMKITCELIRDSLKANNEEIKIYLSNDEKNLLAFANYKKIIMPKKVEFLREYRYSKYEKDDEPRSLCIIGSDVYTIKNEHYHSTNDDIIIGDIDKKLIDDEVKIMQRRLAYLQQ